MDIIEFFKNKGQTTVPNPNYTGSKKSKEPKTINVSTMRPNINPFVDLAIYDEEHQWSATPQETDKYNKAGYTYNPRLVPTMDEQLAESQSFGEKLWNSVKQTFWSEITLGTLSGFADLFDTIAGAAIQSDNDYQNPVSRYLEEARENFRNNNPIYVDPNKSLTTGGLADAGWWLSNLPSVASSLTLLVPGAGFTKGVSLIGKSLGVGKALGYTRKALTGARKVKSVEEAQTLGKIGKWANKQSTIQAANRMFENGLTAATMRTLENYQEARQTYNDMYQEASKALIDMSDEDYADFTDKYKDELQGVDLNDRDEVARQIAHNSATKTFAIDYGNILFDVAQVYALRNPLKLAKNLRSTAATRKAERVARKYAGKSAEDIAKLEAAENYGTKVKNYISDHLGSLKVVAAESSEGVEEAVNYIAQQEGMHYGRTIIDPENNPKGAFGSRLQSYLNSPELHDAAFWGLLGGVVFQSVGSGFNRATNAISGKIKEKKDKNDKTKEETATDWKDRFETAENKRRVGEINGRQIAYNTLVNRLSQITDKKDPFNVDPNDPTKQQDLTSQEAQQVARERAIDEYIVGMTFRAIENGNYNALKDYLRDENVRKALAEKSVIDENSQDVEPIIQRMEEIEQVYNDNIIAIDGISQGNNIPFEYIEIIAKDNALAQLQYKRLGEKLADYEVSAEANAIRFGKNLDENIDYKSAIDLSVSARRLAELRGQKKSILEDKEYAKSLDGQNRLSDIDNEIKQINQHIFSDNWGIKGKYTALSDKLARLIWANTVSTLGKYDENGKFIQDKTSDEYIDATNAIAAKDINHLRDLTGINFEATDTEIISLFGEDSTSGSYKSLADDMESAFNKERGLIANAPNLAQDYQSIATIKIAQLQQQSLIANTTETINAKVNELHNYMNEARKKAIALSENDILDVAKKYGNLETEGYIFGNEDIKDITSADKKKLDDALEVLNLTSSSNRALGENLRHILFKQLLHENSLNAVKSEENATNPQANTEQQNQNLNSPTAGTQSVQNQPSQQASEPNTQPTPQEENQPQKLMISLNINGGIDVTTNIGANDPHYNYTEDENGILSLSLSDNANIPVTLLASNSLYQGFDATAERSGATRIVVSHPKLQQDENENWHIVEPGRITYETAKQRQVREAQETQVQQAQQAQQEVVQQPIQQLTQQPQVAQEQQATVNAEQQSTNTSTGGVVVESPAATQLNQNTAQEEQSEAIAAPSITDDYLESVQDNIQKEANTLFKNRDKSLDAETVLGNIRATLLENHKNDENSSIVNDAIERSIKIINNIAKRKGLIKSASEVLSSSVTEMPNGKYDFSQAYKDAVNQMLDDYCRQVGIREIGGKRYINLEDTLRKINTIFDDKHIANMMFKAIDAYLKTDDSKKRFVVMDDTTDVEEFLKNVKKSTEQRIEERIGNRKNGIHRVAIDRLFEESPEEYSKIFNGLNKGDTLKIRVQNGEAKLEKDGSIVGTLPRPMIDSRLGYYYKYNKGWRTDVRVENGKVISTFGDLLKSILLEDNDTSIAINDAITELNYSKPSDERKQELINKIYDSLVNDFHVVEDGILSNSANKEDAVNHLCTLWKYFNTSNLSRDERNYYIERSVNLWTNKLYDEYNSIDRLGEELDNNSDSIEIRVENINSGEIIRNTTGENHTGNDYEKYTQVNEAIANPDEVTLAIVNPNKRDELITTDGRTIQHDKVGQPGAPHLVIPNKNGIDNYVIGTSIQLNDSRLKGDAKELVQAIRRELNYLVDKYVNEGDYKSLFNFLRTLCYNSRISKGGQLNGLGDNTGLLWYILINKTNKNDNFFNVTGRNGLQVSIHDNTVRSFNYRLPGETTFKEENKNINTRDDNNKENAKLLKKLLNEILDTAIINISSDYIDSDRTGWTPSGFGTRTVDGKFNIYIPNSENPNESFNKTYDSFKDAVVKGGLLRVNTHIENGSNYRRKGINQSANAILEVSFNRKTSSPVEETETTTTSLESNVETILKDDNITDKATTIAETVFTEEQLNSLNSLDLLPKNLIFDENFNRQDENGNWLGNNARAFIKKGTTVVGRRWIDMFNEEGEFSGYVPGAAKMQAIRKLIHEQLHHKLEQTGERKKYIKRIEEIYKEFKESLENYPDDKVNIEKYLFEQKDEEGNYIYPYEIRLEEFLVESLTSEELVEYLNKVDAKVDNKKITNNLWQRILKLLNEIFGWEVRKGSLREKELYALQKNLRNIRKAFSETTKTETTSKVEQHATPSLTEEQKTKKIVTADNVSEADIDLDALMNDIITNSRDTRGSSVTESINSYTPEMNDIKAKAIADGTFMKAPNGNTTNLTERQWLQVRTKNFINWFGDWINNPSKASKVVDENKEPLVVYHGTSKDFNTFNTDINWEWKDKQGNLQNVVNVPNSIYATSNETMATTYYENESQLDKNLDEIIENIYESEYKGIYSVEERDRRIKEVKDDYNKRKQLLKGRNMALFVNLRNVRIVDAKNSNWNKINDNGSIKSTRDLEEENRDKDGVIIHNVFDFGGYNGYIGFEPSTVFIINKANNVKSADSNTGEFSTTNDDIRYSSTTEAPVKYPSVSAFSERLPIDQQAQFNASVNVGEISTACK